MEYAYERRKDVHRQTTVRKRRKLSIWKVLILALVGLLVYEFVYKKAQIELEPENKISVSKTMLTDDLAKSENEKLLSAISNEYRETATIGNTVKADAIDKILLNYPSYPEEYIDLLIRNPETTQFVADYIDFNPRKRSVISIEDDIKVGGIPHFIQWDKRWGYMGYGSSNQPIAINGCGPTSLAMVITGLTGRTDVNPKFLADFSYANNYYVDGVGTSWGLMSEGARQFGLNVQEITLSEIALKNALKSGMPIIASMRPGTFTDVGHFIVLTGVDKDGKFIINDPNSYIKSNETWDYEVFQNEARNFWAFSLQN